MPRRHSHPQRACLPLSPLLLLLFLPALVLLLPSPPSPSPPLPFPAHICNATLFPALCLSSLSLPSPHPSPSALVLTALSTALLHVPPSQSLVLSLLSSPTSPPNPLLPPAARNCLHFLHISSLRLSLASLALPSDPPSAHALASAALHNQYDCLSALRYANDSLSVHLAMRSLLSLSALTSVALSLLHNLRLSPTSTSPWRPPVTERRSFPRHPPPPARPSLPRIPPSLPPDVTVCKAPTTTSPCLPSVQAAVDAAPVNGSRPFVIRIAAGVYDEIVRVPFEKPNVVLVGDGIGRTVIRGSRNIQTPGMTTYDTATVGVDGDGFVARDLTIENSAGPDVHQAVAFRCDADRSMMERVEFVGHQDTLYARSMRQFYRSCRIEGTVDFVFGNSAAVFWDCVLLVRPRQRSPERGERNTVTAQGRTDPGQSTGFVFWNCVVNGTEEYMRLYRRKPKVHRNYLGRPWKEYARTVFLNCYLGELITAEGWYPWRGEFALSTLFYGEFGSSGPGANVARRVPWSNQIPEEHVGMYSVENFIQGDGWLPLQGG